MFPSHEFCLGAMAPSIKTMMSGPILPQPRTLAPIGLPMTDAHIIPGTTAASSVEVDSVREGVELFNNNLPVLCLGNLLGFQAVPPLSNLLTLAAKGFKLKRRSPPPPLLEISLDSLNISSAKRARLDTPPSINPIASRVLHVRRLPPDVVEMDVVKFAMPFGVILNLVLTKKSGQALIEMTSSTVSGTMIEYYSRHPPSLRGCGPIVFQYSRYQELEIVGISRPVSEAVNVGNEHVRRYIDGVVNRPRIIRAYLESNNSQQLTYMEYFQAANRREHTSSTKILYQEIKQEMPCLRKKLDFLSYQVLRLNNSMQDMNVMLADNRRALQTVSFVSKEMPSLLQLPLRTADACHDFVTKIGSDNDIAQEAISMRTPSRPFPVVTKKWIQKQKTSNRHKNTKRPHYNNRVSPPFYNLNPPGEQPITEPDSTTNRKRVQDLTTLYRSFWQCASQKVETGSFSAQFSHPGRIF
ncbi:Polypyrimidine tract-binding protein 2 [Sparganum proliferum]